MAAVARRNLAGAEEVEMVTAEFENWPLPDGPPFDVVVSATSFHWIDPAVRVTKAADALRPGGALAVVRTQHVRGGTEEFFAGVQSCYERFDPETPPGLRPPVAADVDGSDHAREVTESGRFGPTVLRRYERELTYTTTEYVDLLLTYSGHRALPQAARNGLLGCVAGLIDGRYGGRVTKRYLVELGCRTGGDSRPDGGRTGRQAGGRAGQRAGRSLIQRAASRPDPAVRTAAATTVTFSPSVSARTPATRAPAA